MLRPFQKAIHIFLALTLILQTILPTMAANVAYAAPSQALQPQRIQDTKAAPIRSALSNFFADTNGDQRVDANDLQHISDAWNCAAGDACYSAEFDHNGDDVIDVLDLAAVGNEFDISAPTITISTPTNNAVETGSTLRVEGTVSDAHTVTAVQVNGTTAALSRGTNAFSAEIPASDGVLPIHVSAVDEIGQTTGKTILVTVDQEGPFVTVNTPPNRQAVYTTRPDIDIAYTDLVALPDSKTIVVRITDESGTVTDITNQLSADDDSASGTLNFDLAEDETYTLTITIDDTNGVSGSRQTTFYVPTNANTITPPTAAKGAGFVSGHVYDSTTCGGTQEYDPINCTGLAGALVTLEQIDAARLTNARAARLADLEASGSPFGLPHQASRAPQQFRQTVVGTVVTGPDGFFAFPVSATGNYAVRVEKDGFTYGQRLTDIVVEKSTPTTDIFLTPLDSAATSCDQSGCDHTSADGQMRVIVPAGAIPADRAALDIRATEFDQVQYLPSGELPPGTGETYAFNLSGASEITFTVPVTVMIKNDRGFAPGRQINLGYWNQTLLVWEDSGDATVDSTGEWLVMQVTHFSNFDPNDPVTLASATAEAEDKTGRPGENCKADCDSSQIEIASGSLRQEFALPSVNVLDEPMGVTLLYSSQRGNATAVIDIEIGLQALTSAGLSGVDVIQAELFIEGESTEQFSFRVDELEQDGEIGRFRFFWDGRNAQDQRMPSGVYFYSVRIKIPYNAEYFETTNGRFGGPPDPSKPLGVTTTATLEDTLFGAVLLDHDVEGHYGRGWQIADVQRAYTDEDGSMLIDDGNFVLTEYTLPRLDLLTDSPEVRTIGRDLGSSNREQTVDDNQQATEAPTLFFVKSQPSIIHAAGEQEADGTAPSNVRRSSDTRAPNATTVTDDIVTDTTWTLAGSPYLVENDITIAAAATLTVEAGVEIRIDATSTVPDNIFVEGTLLVHGTSGSPVTITDDGFRWGAIIVRNGGHAELIHANLSDGGQTGQQIDGRDAGLYVISSTLIMSNSVMTTFGNTGLVNDGCLYVENSAATLIDTLFEDCGSPGSGSAKSNDTASVVLKGDQTTVQTSNVTITDSHRYPLALDIDLLDAIPTFALDRSIARLFGSTLDRDLSLDRSSGIDTVEFAEDLTIAASATLTLSEGIRFSAVDRDNFITVNGRLVTRGTLADPVVFTSVEDSEGGEWGAIFVDGGSADMEFTSVRFGGRFNVDNLSANLIVKNGDLRFVNSESLVAQDFGGSPNSAHLTLLDSTALIDGALISDNGLNGANPDYGLVIVDNGARAVDADGITIRNTTIVDRDRPIKVPFSQLSSLESNNTIVTGAAGRIDLVGATLNDDLTMVTLSGFGRYEFFNDLTIGAGATVTISAGVQLIADAVADDIFVEGTLIARGTVDNPVIFTSDDDSASGQWGGILIDGGTGDFEFTTIRFGGQINVATNVRAALGVVNGGNLRFASSTLFRNSDTAVSDDAYLFVEDSTAVIRNSLLTDDSDNLANPSHGVILRDSGTLDITFENNVLVHRSRLVEASLANLQKLAGNNLFTNDGSQRFVFTDSAIAGDVTLGPIGNLSTYESDGDVTVTGSLTVEPGTAIRASGRDVLRIDGGTLTAIGTAEEPILFDSLAGNPNSWDGIQLRSGAVGTFEFVTVEEAFRGIETTDSSLTLQNSTLTRNVGGLTVLGGEPVKFHVRINSIFDNTQAGLSDFTNPSVQQLDARLNFWGSPLGPTHVDNPGGDGDSASATVLIDPFLTTGDAIDSTTAINRTAHDTSVVVLDETTGGFRRTYPDGSVVIFNSDGLHTTTRDTNGNEIRYTYNADNSLATIAFVASGQSSADWTWTFTYQNVRSRASVARHLVAVDQVTITDPAGRSTTLGIDKNGNLVDLQEPGLDAPMTFAYGSTHNMTHKTDARGNTTTYEYDENGRMTRSILPPREIYDPLTGQFSTVQEMHDFAPAASDGQVVNGLDSAEPDNPNNPLPKSAEIFSGQQINGRDNRFTTNQFGATVEHTDPLGNDIRHERDERDNITKSVFPSGRCVEFTYDEFDNMLTETLLASDQCDLAPEARDAAKVIHIVNTFEPRFNQLKTTTDALGNTTTYVYDYELDLGEAGNLVKVIYPAVEDGESSSRAVVTPEETFEYNAFGQITRHVNARGVATCFEFTTGDSSEAGTLFANGVTPTLGLLTRIIEDCGGALARVTQFSQFDAAGDALQRVDYVGTSNERTTLFTYDGRGRIVSVTDPLGNVEAIEYDNGDNPIRETRTGHDGQVMVKEKRFNSIDDLERLTESGGGLSRTLVFGYDLNRNETLTQDFNGNQERTVYDANNRPIRFIDAAGNETTVSYDSEGRTVATTDGRGNVTAFEYDDFGRKSAIIEDSGGLNLRTDFVRDKTGLIVQESDPNGVLTCYEYDSHYRNTHTVADCGGLDKTTLTSYTLSDQPVAMTDALGRTKTMQYDALNRVTQVTDKAGHSATIEYDAADNIVRSVSEVGQPMTFSYDVADRMTQSTNALGGTLTIVYDAFGQLLSQTDELGRTTRYEYDGLDRRTAIIDAAGGRTVVEYDNNDNVLALTDPRGSVTRYQFDEFDQIIGVVRADGSTRAVEYDANLNKVRVIDGFGNAIVLTYDAADRLISRTERDGAQASYTLDAAGNIVSETDANGNVTVQTFDNLYRVVQLDRPNGETVSYTYDLLGNQLTLTDGENNTTTWTYDAMDRVLTETNALGQTRTSEYAADGMLTRYVDRNGNDYRFTYDALRRMTQELEINSGASRTFTFDAAGQTLQAQDSNSSYVATYTALGHVASVAASFTTGAPDVSYSYAADAASNVTQRTEQINGEVTGTTTFQHDALNRVTQITQQALNHQRATIGYDANGSVVQIGRFNNANSSVATTTWTYTPDTAVASMTHTTPVRAALTYNFTYDGGNRLTNSTSPDGAATFDYDTGNQLTAATYDFQSDEAFSYDNNGNRTAGHVVAADNRLTSDGTFSYTYDAEGNLTRKTIIASGEQVDYTWDHLNRLVGVESRDSGGGVLQTVSYTYDVYGRRIGKTVNGVAEHYVYDEQNLSLVFDDASNLVSRYLFGPFVDVVLAEEVVSGDSAATRWFLSEANKSVTDIIDDDGQVLNHLTYDSFGNVTSESDPSAGTRWAYTGRERDVETGLYFYRTRYFDAGIGRFIAQDRLGFAGGDTNLYRYAGNDGVNHSDPFGTMRGIARSVAQGMQRQEALANNVKPTRRQVERSWWESFTEFALDATIYLTDNAVVNSADQFASGMSSSLSFGLTDVAREKMYGEHATKNHTGGFRTAGELFGFVGSFFIPGASAANLAKVRALLAAGKSGQATILALAQALSLGQKISFGVAIDMQIAAIQNDPCLSEEEKMKQIMNIISNLRNPKVRTPNKGGGNTNSQPPTKTKKDKRSPLEKMREKNRQKAKERIKQQREQKKAEEQRRYEQELKDYLKKRSKEEKIKRIEQLEKAHKLDERIIKKNQKIINDRLKNGDISKKRHDELQKANRDMSKQERMDTDFNGIINKESKKERNSSQVDMDFFKE